MLKLKPYEVREIKQRLALHTPKVRLAKKFKVSEATIRQIARGDTWKDVEVEKTAD